MQRKTKARPTATFKTRYEPPTLDEAIAAAQGLAPDIEGQTEIAASLMGLPTTDVRPAVLQARVTYRSTPQPAFQPTFPVRGPSPMQSVIVERRRPRVIAR
jgi:hypothetical protein